MYVKNWLDEELSLVVTEEGSSTIISTTDLDFSSSSTVISTSQPISSSIITTRSSTTTVATTPGGGEEDEKKWVLPLIIGLGCLLLIVGLAAVIIIYRKWKCFGLPLPFLRRNAKLAQPIKKIASSLRSSIRSIRSTFSSSTGSLPGREKSDKQFKKYSVKLDSKVDGQGINDWKDVVDWIGVKDFSGEFEAMKRVDLKDIPVTVALKQENLTRNRFSNVLPYDRTRVVLTAEGASGHDYINASYVSGYRKQNEFICTQGPLQHTVVDFWRMCWETRAEAIIMLTKCYEKNQEKCYPYWPSGNTGNSTFGDIKISLEKKSTWKLSKGGGHHEGQGQNSGDHLWLVSELIMEKEGETDPRKIIHIVFLSWPDFGVVDPPCSLISFVKHVRGLVEGDNENNNGNGNKEYGPMVVHCSAGVGRSGVFIAVHHLIQLLEEFEKEDEGQGSLKNKTVNIFQTVAKMRRERMGMVQNLQQYTLIYNCLKVLASTKGDSKEQEPSMVSNDVIQGSDWGLQYPIGG